MSWETKEKVQNRCLETFLLFRKVFISIFNCIDFGSRSNHSSKTFQQINQIDYHFVSELTNKWNNKISALVHVSISGHILCTMKHEHVQSGTTDYCGFFKSTNPSRSIFPPTKWFKNETKTEWKATKHFLYAIQRHLCMYLVHFAISVFMRPFELFFFSLFAHITIVDEYVVSCKL